MKKIISKHFLQILLPVCLLATTLSLAAFAGTINSKNASLKFNSNDKIFGSVRASDTITVSKKTVTLYATPNEYYELKNWTVVYKDGSTETINAGSADANGVYSTTVTPLMDGTVTANFELAEVNSTASNFYTIQDGKLYLFITNITDETNIDAFTQALVLQANTDNAGASYTENDIVSITLATASGTNITKAFKDLFSATYLAALKNNLQQVDLSNATFQWNTIPASMFSSFTALNNVVLPNNIVTIATKAFEYTTSLTDITLPTSLVTIGQRSFQGSGIVHMTFPGTLKNVQPCAFIACTSFIGTSTIECAETNLSYNVVAYPDSVECVGDTTHVVYSLTGSYDCAPRQMYLNSQVTGISYHGAGSTILFSHLLSAPNWKNSYFDFRNSGLNENQLALIPFTSPDLHDKTVRTCFFDIRGCDIDWTTHRGEKLLARIQKFNAENPNARVLYDPEGRPRNTDYTVVSAGVTINNSENLEAALTRWANARGATGTAVQTLIATITDLTVITDTQVSLAAADFTYIKTKIGQSLYMCDLLDAKCANNTIPENAFNGLANLRMVVLPEDLQIIGASAFLSTGLQSVSFPESLTQIGNRAFDLCFALEGDCILPNGLTTLGSNVFAGAGFKSIEYHGTANLNLKTNFAYACESSVEYLDLRGCQTITFNSLPSTWNALEEGHLDYCRIDNIYNSSMWIYRLQQSGVLLTLHHQYETYGDLETMLSEDLYGKTNADYPQESADLFSYDYSNLNLWNFDETGSANNIYMDSAANTSRLIDLGNDTYRWELYLHNSYNALPDAGNYQGVAANSQNICTDLTRLEAMERFLLIGAVNLYNQNNDTNLTVSQLGVAASRSDINYKITEIRITANPKKYISTCLFNRILPSDGFVNVKVLDLSSIKVVNSYNAATRTGTDAVCNTFGNMNFSLSGGIMYYRDANNNLVQYSSTFGCIYPELTSLILPSKITKIENQALRNLPKLTEIVIPNTVQSMGRWNFNQDTALKTITLPAQLTDITSDLANYNILVAANQISGTTWNYHGTSLAAASHAYLVNSINNSKPVRLDFSNSGITAADLMAMDVSRLTYLDITGSAVETVQPGTTEYQNLVTFLTNLQNNGAVLYTDLSF